MFCSIFQNLQDNLAEIFEIWQNFADFATSLQLRGRDRAPNETTPSREATGVASLDAKAMEARLKTLVERVCEGLLPGSPFRERRPGTEKGVLLPIRARPSPISLV